MTARKENIINTATILFSKNGYDNTSIRELAKAVELSVAGLYYFFQNKEEILFSILNSSVDRLIESVLSAVNEDDDPQANITRIIDYVVKEVIESKKEIGLLLKEIQRLQPGQVEIIKNKERKVIKLIRTELSRLSNEGRLKNLNLTSTAFALLAMMSFAHNWFDQEGQLSTEDFAAETNMLFLNGILK